MWFFSISCLKLVEFCKLSIDLSSRFSFPLVVASVLQSFHLWNWIGGFDSLIKVLIYSMLRVWIIWKLPAFQFKEQLGILCKFRINFVIFWCFFVLSLWSKTKGFFWCWFNNSFWWCCLALFWCWLKFTDVWNCYPL